MSEDKILKAKLELQAIIDDDSDPEANHGRADKILLDLIDNKEISEMFEEIAENPELLTSSK